jgi:hypothetical protein
MMDGCGGMMFIDKRKTQTFKKVLHQFHFFLEKLLVKSTSTEPRTLQSEGSTYSPYE